MNRKKLSLLLLLSLLLVALLCSCDAPMETEHEPVHETNIMTEAEKEREAFFRQHSIKDFYLGEEAAYVIDNQIAVHDEILAVWNQDGYSQKLKLCIIPYAVYDLDPFLDSTLYSGKTYKEHYEFYRFIEARSRLPDATEEYIARAESERLFLYEKIPQLQREQKLQTVLDCLSSHGIAAEKSTLHGGSIFADLAAEELLLLQQTPLMFFIVYERDRQWPS